MIKIYTIADKSPQFIGWQVKSFKDHLKDDYEFIVMNNSSSLDLDEAIQGECLAAGVKWINVENKDFSHPCFACSAPVQEIIDKYISQDRECISAIIDSDLFLMRSFSFEGCLGNYDIAGLSQARDAGTEIIEYIWNAFMIISPTAPNITKLKMWPGTLNHAHSDVGACSYFYFLYNDVKWKKLPSTGIITEHPQVMELIPERVRNEYDLSYQMEVLEGSWIHLRGGSNWNYQPKELYDNKQNFIKKLVGI
jgi:hypothetical protein